MRAARQQETTAPARQSTSAAVAATTAVLPRLSPAGGVDILATMSSASAHEAGAAAAPRRTTMVVVLGMHRSGTSALARSCNLLGVDLGSDFIPTQDDNRAGFWEDVSVKETDDLALASHGLLWDDVRPLPEPWRDGFGGPEVRARLRRTLDALAARGPLCGVKDPRISRLLPLWLPVLDEVGATPVFLIALREPAAVARSLARRDGIGEARALLLWLRYVLEAERDTRGRRRAFVCFDELLRDWRGALARAAETSGLTWPVAYDAASEAIATFLDPELRHHADAPAPGGDGLARLAHEAFVAVRALRDGETPEHHGALDGIRATLAAGDATLGVVLAELEEELAMARRDVTHVAAEPAPGVANATAADPARGVRSAHQRELDRARREALLAHELVGQRDRELADATARFLVERDALRERVAAGEAAVAAREADVSALRHAIEVLEVEIASLKAERASALQVIAAIEQSLSWRVTAPVRALSDALRRR